VAHRLIIMGSQKRRWAGGRSVMTSPDRVRNRSRVMPTAVKAIPRILTKQIKNRARVLKLLRANLATAHEDALRRRLRDAIVHLTNSYKSE